MLTRLILDRNAMNTGDLSRRVFIQRLCLFGAAGGVLSSCGGGGKAASEMPAGTSDEAFEAFSCTDTSGLTDAEVTMRTTLNYVDWTPIEGKTCDNCALYVPPEGGASCGTCLTVKGPVHPKGYCDIWAAQTV